jgi:hypothetical protein
VALQAQRGDRLLLPTLAVKWHAPLPEVSEIIALSLALNVFRHERLNYTSRSNLFAIEQLKGSAN